MAVKLEVSKQIPFPELDHRFKLQGIKFRTGEHVEQAAVIQWASWMVFLAKRGEEPKHWVQLEWLFAIPNGGDRDKITAGRMKAEGVVSGVADLALPHARGGFFGLYIEMKKFDGGAMSENQQRFKRHVKRNGYAFALCHGAEQALVVLKDYMAMPPTPGRFVSDE